VDFDNIFEFYNSSFSNLIHDLFLFSNNNYIFLNLNDLENSNKNILKKIKLINKIKNKIDFKIRNNLNLLFIVLFNKE
jgi:hypothetical protein